MANFTSKPKTCREHDQRAGKTHPIRQPQPSAAGAVTMAANPPKPRWFLLPNLEKFKAAPTMNLYSVVNSVSLISMYLFPFLITFPFPSRIYN